MVWRTTAMVANQAVYDASADLLAAVGLATCPLCGAETESDLPACRRHMTTVLLRNMR